MSNGKDPLGLVVSEGKLISAGAPKYTAAAFDKDNILHVGKAYQWGNSRLGYWRIAGSPVLKGSIANERLAEAGYFSILRRYYESLHLCG